MIAHVDAAVIMSQPETSGDAGGEISEMLLHSLT
jgi:uncharacterized protein (DUF305 family)